MQMTVEELSKLCRKSNQDGSCRVCFAEWKKNDDIYYDPSSKALCKDLKCFAEQIKFRAEKASNSQSHVGIKSELSKTLNHIFDCKSCQETFSNSFLKIASHMESDGK